MFILKDWSENSLCLENLCATKCLVWVDEFLSILFNTNFLVEIVGWFYWAFNRKTLLVREYVWYYSVIVLIVQIEILKHYLDILIIERLQTGLLWQQLFHIWHVIRDFSAWSKLFYNFLFFVFLFFCNLYLVVIVLCDQAQHRIVLKFKTNHLRFLNILILIDLFEYRNPAGQKSSIACQVVF